MIRNTLTQGHSKLGYIANHHIGVSTNPLCKSNSYDHINIFIVAMGDRNASDKANGCGDSLVPVIIAIQPTPGVLPAAIHELLKMEGWSHHSQSRLYNALYVSTLTLEDILVIKGKTMINFSDTLICGEKYVISRIEEQLTTLALQFSTVESVQIFVNDELMEKLHDLRA